MLQNTKALFGTRLAATDGEIGHIKDFYFDDKLWVVRYLVADTGSWLSGRLVLLAPHAFRKLDPAAGTLDLNLTRSQIEKSPSIESHRPVSRQYEIEYYQYYGWPSYWNGGAMWGMGGYPMVLAPSPIEMEARTQVQRRDDVHLRSICAITGYDIQALDGSIGHVAALIVDDRNWAVVDIVIDVGHWYSGKAILVSTGKVLRISYEESKVFVSLTKADLQKTADTDVVRESSPAVAALSKD